MRSTRCHRPLGSVRDAATTRHAHAALLAALLVVLVVGAAPSVAQSLPPGRLLIAAESVDDPALARTVVLLVRHSSEGAIGLVLNRPTWMWTSRLFEGLDGPGMHQRVYRGGPVDPDRWRLLGRTSRLDASDVHVYADVHVSRARERLDAFVADPDATGAFRVFLGHVQWEPGQLEVEVETGRWHVTEAEPEFLFGPLDEATWDRLSLAVGAPPRSTRLE